MSNRAKEIGELVSTAMKNLKGADWSRENPETIAAQEHLENAMDDYYRKQGTKEQVKQAYKAFAKLHK